MQHLGQTWSKLPEETIQVCSEIHLWCAQIKCTFICRCHKFFKCNVQKYQKVIEYDRDFSELSVSGWVRQKLSPPKLLLLHFPSDLLLLWWFPVLVKSFCSWVMWKFDKNGLWYTVDTNLFQTTEWQICFCMIRREQNVDGNHDWRTGFKRRLHFPLHDTLPNRYYPWQKPRLESRL